MAEELLSRIVTDARILAGKPVIRGLRISVDQVLKALASGIETDEVLREYPELEPADIKACLLYAAELVEEERVYPIQA